MHLASSVDQFHCLIAFFQVPQREAKGPLINLLDTISLTANIYQNVKPAKHTPRLTEIDK